MPFRKDFLWGAATAASQVEGGYLEGGKGLSTADVMLAGKSSTYLADKGTSRQVTETVEEGKYYPSHRASDFFHHMEEDIGLMKEQGLKCYRFSIAWSRIFPNGDDEDVNEEGLAFYDRIIDMLRAADIEPMITLSHFDTPLGLQKYGSWLNRKTVFFFKRYARTVFERYKGRVKYWLTFNEINAMSFQPWMAGGVSSSSEQDRMIAAYHQFLASALAVKEAHEIDSSMKVGMMYSGHFAYPASPDPKDVQGVYDFMHRMLMYTDVPCRGFYPSYARKMLEREGIVLPVCEGDAEILRNGTADYFAFSYYLTHVMGKKTKWPCKGLNGIQTGYDNPYLEKSDWGWPVNPQGLRHLLTFFYERYNLPMMIVENGIGARDAVDENGKIHDPYRIDYLRKHIEEMKKAVELDGVDVMGYTIWSFEDLPSASTGQISKRYGTVYVDYDDEGDGTGRRLKKDSFEWYRKVIASDGEEL